MSVATPETNNDQAIFTDISTELNTHARLRFKPDFDQKNTLNDWAAYTTIYLGNALRMGIPLAEARRQLVKAAGLLVSAINAIDSGTIVQRFYDPPKRDLPNPTHSDATGEF